MSNSFLDLQSRCYKSILLLFPGSRTIAVRSKEALSNKHHYFSSRVSLNCLRERKGNSVNISTTSPGALVPVKVLGLSGTIQDISAGFRHTCAIVSGSTKCWGENSLGQLGNSTTTNSLAPVQAIGLTSGGQSISAATEGYSNCGIVSGNAFCWGYNFNGNLGVYTTNTKLVPTQVH